MRIILPKGEQNKFISKVLGKLSIAEVARLCNLSERTIRDWRREKFFMKKDLAKLLAKKSGILFPKKYEERNDYWSASPYKGAEASIKKYGRVGGDQAYQKKKWYEWWNSKGKYQNNGCIVQPLPIRHPRFSKKLAEFTGIILGDGHVARGQLAVFTNMTDDRDYGYFIKNLIGRLFNVSPSVSFRRESNVMKIAVSRKKLIEFCNQKLGLHVGNKLKQGLDIPNWIKGNLEYEKACVRGLMDTDGCIFNEIHKIKGKIYSYKRLSFVSASPALRKAVFDILHSLGLNPKIRSGRCVQVEDKEKIKEYFKIIGTNNLKHLNRYQK